MKYKNALRTVYACGLARTDPASALAGSLDRQEIKKQFDHLIRHKMITKDLKITPKGRSTIKVVLIGGVFDIIHHGHIHTLNAARKMGDVLVVVVASDSTARARKNKVVHSARIRHGLVGAIEGVDACMIGNDSGNMFAIVDAVRPDIIALGYDQAHNVDHIKKGCQNLGLDIQVVRLESPVPDVASSLLKNTVSWDIL